MSHFEKHYYNCLWFSGVLLTALHCASLAVVPDQTAAGDVACLGVCAYLVWLGRGAHREPTQGLVEDQVEHLHWSQPS